MKLKNIKQNKGGYSLIEIVIYLAIFTTMSIVVINSFIVVLSSFSAIRSNHDLLESGSVSMERIAREIRQAKNIDIVNSSVNGGEYLQLNSTDSSGNNMIIKFIKEGNALNLYKNGTIVGNILNQNIIVNSISFYRIATSNSEAIKIQMEIEDTRGKSNKIQNFYNTVVVRGGY